MSIGVPEGPLGFMRLIRVGILQPENARNGSGRRSLLLRFSDEGWQFQAKGRLVERCLGGGRHAGGEIGP